MVNPPSLLLCEGGILGCMCGGGGLLGWETVVQKSPSSFPHLCLPHRVDIWTENKVKGKKSLSDGLYITGVSWFVRWEGALSPFYPPSPNE